MNDPSLLYYWKFNNNSNTVSNNLTGTDVGITYGNQYGKYGIGSSFTGNTSQMKFTNTTIISGNTDFTLSFWILFNAAECIISRRSSWPPDWEIVYITGTYVQLYIGGVGNLFADEGPTLDSNWHNIVISRGGSRWRIYKDSILYSTKANSVIIPTNHILTFGRSDDTGSNSAKMNLDDVMYFTKELTQEEISLLYNEAHT